ncbi:WcaI family glycosyltransferase [Novosphingobium sp. KACC 22771]|uniref:WcaI family glycosyltransferase n=1 Tax=Novosphingobium sp. KACC 22771 TaxID=3025670 RepID=UPI002365399D|nr:WcaI family glycosyltransferase [Novosphingobium sp. KACC 22771]WDF72875.1 WcaI family glycosyltransferase [Novosphingobium sp. KACC 22771]
MTDALRLAIVGLNYAPEEIGIARYTADMARALATRGHAVSVISGKPYYPAWHVPQEWRGGWRKSVEDGVAITRCPLYVPAQPSGMKRIIHLASYALSALGPAIRMARRDRPEVVFCIAPALLSVPVAWIAARLAGAKLWVHIQDFEVEAAFATGLVEQKGSLAKWGARAEAFLLGLADIVSSISPQMVAKLHEKGIAPHKTIEIRNWADSTIQPDPEQGAAYRAQWGLQGKKVCLYSGNIANKQGIDILIEASRRLQGREDIAFVICGDGPNRARLQELALGLRNIQFHGLQPSARMGELLGLATIHLLPQIPGAADLVLPSKLTNMLASGRPVVATTEPGTGLFDEVDGCGICTKPGDADALAQAIVKLADDPQTCAEMAANGRERSVERWSMRRIIDRLEARATLLARGGGR